MRQAPRRGKASAVDGPHSDGVAQSAAPAGEALSRLLRVDLSSEVPIYVQIKNQLKLLIDSGSVSSGAQLPTVRELALSLNVNANTISRVYSDLAREGYAVLRKGVGTFAALREAAAISERPGEALLTETLRQLKSLGYSKRQILELAAELMSQQSS